MKYDKIYVLAPVKISTGGVELSHQLVSTKVSQVNKYQLACL